MSEKPNEKSIVKQEQNGSLDFLPDDKMSLARLKLIAKEIAESSMAPSTNPADILVAILTGKEMGFGLMASINNISNVDGSAFPSINIHVAKALSNGITYDVVEEYQPVYSYFLAKSKTQITTEEFNELIKDNAVLIHSKTPKKLIERYEKEGRTLVTRGLIDHRTTIIFYRMVRLPNGSFKEITYKSSSTLSNSIAEIGSSKDGTIKYNFQKMPRRMLFADVFRTGFRRIGADFIIADPYSGENLEDTTTGTGVTGSKSDYPMTYNDAVPAESQIQIEFTEAEEIPDPDSN